MTTTDQTAAFADQRAHDVFWMTAQEREEQDRYMARFDNLQELADAEGWEADDQTMPAFYRGRGLE